MGGWIGVAIGVAGTVMLFRLGHPVLGGIAVFFAVLQFWSFGIMHNYASAHGEEAGWSPAEIRQAVAARPRHLNPDAAPDWLTLVSMVAWFASVALLIAAGIFWAR